MKKTILIILFIILSLRGFSQVINLTFDPLKMGYGIMVSPIDIKKFSPIFGIEKGRYLNTPKEIHNYTVLTVYDRIDLIKYSGGLMWCYDDVDNIQTNFSLLLNYNHYSVQKITKKWTFDLGIMINFNHFSTSAFYDPIQHQAKIGYGYRF